MLTEVDWARLLELMHDPITCNDATIVRLCDIIARMDQQLRDIRKVVNRPMPKNAREGKK